MRSGEEVTVKAVLIDLRHRFPQARAMMFDPNASPGTEAALPMPEFLAEYFPQQMPAAQSPLDFVVESDRSAVSDCIDRSRATLSAESPEINLTDGSIAICAIVNLTELDASLALFVDPESVPREPPPIETMRFRSLGELEVTTDGVIIMSMGSVHEVFADASTLTDADIFELIGPDLATAFRGAATEIAADPARVVRLQTSIPREGGDRPIHLELKSVGGTATDHLRVIVTEPEGSAAQIPDQLRSDEEFRTLAQTLPVGVFVLGRLGPISFANDLMHRIYGVEKLVDYEWLEAIHPDDRPHVDEAMSRLRQDRLIDIKARIVTPTGDIRWCRIAARDLRDESGSLNSIVGLVEDITEIRSLQNQLEHEASTDALTALPNRATLLHHLEETLGASALAPGFTAVLFIDLDGFKLINDTQGHAVGDLLLQTVAERFSASLRPGDLIARFGGDEFVVVARKVADASVAHAVAKRLHEVLESPIVIHNQPLSTTASIGVSLSSPGVSRADELLSDADLAMYEAKRLGRRRTVVYDNGLREAASQRFDISTDLRHARARRELRVDYQPIHDLTTSKPVGVEALIRWDHPAHGLLKPDAFIDVAEETGLVSDIGDWVVEQACADLARLRYSGVVGPDFFVSINISTLQLSMLNNLATTAQAALTTYGLRPEDIVFELTESIPVDSIPEAAERIQQLKSVGFRLAIDDFGTGYSSLEYLTMLPFDIMKLDPTFTARIPASESANAVLESIMVMARRMGFAVVAEGIEHESQRVYAQVAGVTYGQGFFYNRPENIDVIIHQFGLLGQEREPPSSPARS